MDRQVHCDIQVRILQILKQSIQWAKKKQQKLLSQVLDIQKKINRMQETKSIIRKKQAKIIEKQQKKEQNFVEQYSKKIDEIINRAQQQINQLDNPTKKNKIISNKIHKNVQPLPQIQKKPPIPTVNRSKDPQIVTHKPNYHYRNKNEVTGKITETPVTKSVNKIHSNSSIGRKEGTTIFNSTNSIQKQKQKQKQKNIQKISKFQSLNNTKISQSSNKNPINTNKNMNEIKKQSSSTDNKKNFKQIVQYVDFSCFRIPLKNLIQRQNQNNQKRMGTKKNLIQQMISQYTKNQLGYKNNQNKSMNNFLNAFNKLAATRARLPLNTGLKIQPRNWQGHIQTFSFENLLNNFQSMLDNNPISEQYAPNQKQAYKIKLWHKRLNQIFIQQIQNTRQNLKLPPTLGIDFQMRNNQDQEIQIGLQGEDTSQNPYKPRFYELLFQQLEQLKNMQNFDKQALKKLRTLISIGMYKGKRSPVIVQTPKYEQWQQYYQS